MTPDHEHGEVLEDLVVDDQLVDEHIAQGSLVRAFRALADNVEGALSAGAVASSPRVLGAFFASMAAWQLAYIRSRGVSKTTTAVSPDTPPSGAPATVTLVVDESGSIQAPIESDAENRVIPVACSPTNTDNPIIADPCWDLTHAISSEELIAAYERLGRQSTLRNYVHARYDDADDLDDVSDLIDRAHRRKYNRRQLHGADRVTRRVANPRRAPQSIRRELAMV